MKNQRGYSLIEIGVGLIIISIFMICSLTMIRGTYNTYKLVEQKDIAMFYLVKGIERELLDAAEGVVINITDNPTDTVVTENSTTRKVTVTNIQPNNMTLTTTVESLPPHNGIDYQNSKVKIVTSTIDFFLKKGVDSTKRSLSIKTLKIGGN